MASVSEYGYDRLFEPNRDAPADPAALAELGAAMVCDNVMAHARDDSRIPAGYTYLGQFIAHDLTFDASRGLPDDPVPHDSLASRRSPFLDLSSIYGRGPESPDSEFYQPDGVRLRLGPVVSSKGPRWNDLPRTADGKAIIGDERNDENLISAQTTVALMRFHNAVADHLDAGRAGSGTTFDEVRDVVVQHVQSVVLHDFAWRLVSDDVYRDVLENGRRIFWPEGPPAAALFKIPVEFSHAAFRFGHSMVRSLYRWSDSIELASPRELFKNTGRNSPTKFTGLHEDWIIDWKNFYPLDATPAQRRKQINFSRRIDPRFTKLFGQLPHGELKFGEPPNLAARDLLRGHSVNLPSGQQVAREMEHRFGIFTSPLSPQQLKQVCGQTIGRILEAHGLDKHTPLLLYILAEAEIEQHGQELGRIGGRIVLEVLHAAVEMASQSILDPQQWAPSLPATHGSIYTMPDLIAFSAH